ncbi:hypothetical protein VKT23_002226 [Stygiomarasmius scandens]|uniref:DUF7923 domain-containing protein n=1 Tax=Marasmiellus scandens TaxID=2682957 RepID=A0ABR1K6U0_9AGAR
MTSPRVGNITQELWQDTLNNLMNLSQATVKHNIELETRINELERELASWKQSYGVAVDSLNRQTSEYQTQVATLNKQLLDMDIFTKNNPLILCVINGDNTFFEHSLVSQGFSGGRIAATKLTKAIADFVFSEGTPVPNNVTFWVTLYFKKSNLTNVLVKNQFCTVDQLEAFLTGFTQSSQRFTSIDVGSGEEGSDVKIREYLQTFTQFPQTMRVFCTGCHDANYTSTFNGLSSDELLGKLVAIQSSTDEIAEPSQYPIPTLMMDGLFISPPLPSSLAKRSPVPVGSFNTVVLNGGLISPQSPARPSRRLIDPNFPLHKRTHYFAAASFPNIIMTSQVSQKILPRATNTI